MSLINQMLQELEKRGEDSQTHAAGHYVQFGEVGRASRAGMNYRLGLMFLMFVLFVAAYFVWNHRSSEKPLMQVSQLKPNQEVVIASSVSTAASAGNSTPPLPTADVVPDMSPALSTLGLSLKLSTQVNPAALSVANESVQAQQTDAIRSALPGSAMIGKSVKEQTKQETPPTKSIQAPDLAANSEPLLVKKSGPATALNQSSLPVTMIKEVSIPQRAEGEYRQATVYQQQGRVNEALTALENALKLDPTHAPARQLLISLLLETKRHDDAIRELRQGLVLEPAQLNFSMILARLLVERAKLSDAIDVLQKSLGMAQDRPDYLAFLAALQQKTGHHKEAISLYRQALRVHSQNGAWWMGLGISLQAEAQSQDAIDAYKQAKLQPGLSAELHAFIDQKINQLQK